MEHPRPTLADGKFAVERQVINNSTPVLPGFRTVVVKTMVTHTVTYFVIGLLAYFVFDYQRLFAETELRFLMRPTADPLVMAGPLFQPIRGLIFGALLFMLREMFFATRRGWIRLWLVLVVVGIIGPMGPVPGSLEGMIYTKIPLLVQLKGLPEVLLQTLAFSRILCDWVDHPEKRWLNWCLGGLFLLACLLPLLGLLASRAGAADAEVSTPARPPASHSSGRGFEVAALLHIR
jgi:hypothetical protein